jgi:hypothetical protein
VVVVSTAHDRCRVTTQAGLQTAEEEENDGTGRGHATGAGVSGQPGHAGGLLSVTRTSYGIKSERLAVAAGVWRTLGLVAAMRRGAAGGQVGGANGGALVFSGAKQP